jgi:dTDP-4-amino-4,6-dideoxygalactose transaminase
MRIPFVRPDLPETRSVAAACAEIMESGILTKGPRLAAFEAAVRDAVGVRHAIGVSSCTVGLALLMRSLKQLRPGERSEVILPSFMFLAGPAAIVWAGLTPVFVEADPATWTIDPRAVEAAITPRTFAILGCHTFGVPCGMSELERIGSNAGVPVVFDAAHAFGSKVGGRQVGREGLAQVFSLSPTKLVVAGEGGIVTTGDDALAAAVLEAREYGNDGNYGCRLPGLNGRLMEMAAAVGHASLARLPEAAARRAEAAAAYAAVLGGLPGIGLQKVPEGATTSWKDFSITIDPKAFGASRDDVRAALASQGVDSRAYYSPACHRMDAFAGYHDGRGPLTATDRLAATSLSLPMGRHVGPDEARSIAGMIAEVARR